MAGEQRIQLRRGTSAEWASANPTLSVGEPGYDSTRGDLKVGDGATAWSALRSILPPGVVLPYANDSAAPGGFLYCDGSAVSRTTYSELFDAIGTTWGVGDGSTTFNVPDLRGAFIRGTGSHGSETMADSNPFAGPAVGSFEDDQMQGHWHDKYIAIGGRSISSGSTASNAIENDSSSNNDTLGDDDVVRGAADDGTNGTPRTGDETRPFAAGMRYIIKV